jgi:hypothetical protein
MVRRWTAMVICVLALTAGSAGVAAAAATHAATTVRSAPMKSVDGIDPAERDAVNGTLGYHEKRNYPYGMLVFLVVMTPVALVAIRRWTPKVEDGTR